MDSSPPVRPADETGHTQPLNPVRYGAAARAAAGCVEEQFAGETVFDVLGKARRAHLDNPRFSRVLDVSSFLLGDQPVATRDLATVRVADGDVLEVLPPFAGGAWDVGLIDWSPAG
jgi:molybdopterin synthase sulfur carrier subunit